MGSLVAKAADCKSVTRKHRRFVLRFTSVGAEQTSTGRFALLQKHACKHRKTLRALPSNSYKLFEKSLTKNFFFCERNRAKSFSFVNGTEQKF